MQGMDPIEDEDLSPPGELTKSFFRATSPHLTHEEFERKWKTAQMSALRFFRSFPQAYYIDLTRVPGHHVPGRLGICFGDLHPENFGFITFAEGPRYVFNDLDDAGLGPVGLDALRYFTAVELMGASADTGELVDYYRDVMRDPGKGRALPDELLPDHEAVSARELAKVADGDNLIFTEKTRLGAATLEEREAVAEVFRDTPELAGQVVLDVAQRERAHGGSGGLRRLWVLTRGAGDRRAIVELKELAKPATAWGRQFSPLEDRVRHVRKELWAGLTPVDHVSVMIGSSEFLVRNRLGRFDYDFEKLSKRARRAVIEAQITVVARHHRQLFHPSEYQDLDDWLQAGARTLRKRWTSVFERAR